MVKYWMGAQCCLKYNRSVSVNHFPQLKVDSQKRFQKNIFQNQFPLVWKWVIFFFYTGTRNKLYRQSVCVRRENPPSQQNIKSREQRRKEKPLHMGDATSMSKVSESVEEVQKQTFSFTSQSSPTVHVIILLLISLWGSIWGCSEDIFGNLRHQVGACSCVG